MRKLKVLFVSLFIAMTVSMFSSCTLLALFKVGQELSLWVSLPGIWHEVDNSGNIVYGGHELVIRMDKTAKFDDKEVILEEGRYKRKGGYQELGFYVPSTKTQYDFEYYYGDDSTDSKIVFTKGLSCTMKEN